MFFDGALGTLTIYPQSPLVFSTIDYVNIFVVGQLLATEVSAVPEPVAAAALLALGAAGTVVGRRRSGRIE
ncbi:MAG TPA: PEP-CTERM sorting domain-containing protein [Opitutus sp.]|nr:PEP-CTERM sorting domain-containing protein [Opitutus sp.]